MKFVKTTVVSLAAIAALALEPAAASERYCREYTKTVTVGGRYQQGYGTACYQPDGSWEVVSDATTQDYLQPAQYVVQEPYYNAPEPVYYQEASYQTTDYSGLAVLGTALVAGVLVASALDDDGDRHYHKHYNAPKKHYNKNWKRGHDRGRGHGRGHR